MKKVLVGGVFSIIHPGHIFFLGRARSMGDFLVVVIASDRTALRRKGKLFRTAEKRKLEVEKTGIADRVIIGDSENRFRVIETERPDIIALGYDQGSDESRLRRFIRTSGIRCKVIRIRERFGDYSSSKIMEQK
jgi:FAD synthetase